MRTIAAGLALLAGAAVLWLYVLGYFSGPVFVDFPAAAGATPARAGLGAIVLSGDMGLRVGMASDTAAALAADGIPVVGVNSMRFFAQRRTPDEVGILVADAMQRAIAISGARSLIVVGQSYGADMLQLGLVRLPAALRAKVRLVVLVVPTDTIYLQVSPAEYFEWGTPDAPAVASARQLSWAPVLCIRGESETTSLCPLLRQRNVRSVTLPGGHALHRNHEAVHEAIMAALRETS